MKKIPSLFVRDYEKEIVDSKNITIAINDQGDVIEGMSGIIYKKGRFLATEQITPGCEWVINGEGIATRKWDGTAVMVRNGLLYKRYDAKNGKIPPIEFEPCQDADPITGHWPGWVPIDIGKDKWIIEAHYNYRARIGKVPDDGTYEAIGPKIGGNKDKWDRHELMKHGGIMFNMTKYGAINVDYRSYNGLKIAFTIVHHIEGIVFHHPDGRMCKVKRSDFGLEW